MSIDAEIMACNYEATISLDDEIAEGLSRLLHEVDERMIANFRAELSAHDITPSDGLVEDFVAWARRERRDVEGTLSQVLMRAGYIDSEAAKRLRYATLYGCGNRRAGTIINPAG